MDSKKTRTLAVILVAVIILVSSLIFIPHMMNMKKEDDIRNEEIIILHSNDVHGAIEGYGKIAALKKEYEKEGKFVLLLDAGDFIQGDPSVNFNEGKVAIEMMNMAGYDAVALGNHEFDYGYENIKELEKEAEYPLLAANVLYEGENAFPENIIIESPAGLKIGIFGLDTPETATKSHPAKIKGVKFLGQEKPEDMFLCAQKQVDVLKDEGCDFIICLGHIGTDPESAGHRSVDILENVSGIDLFIDGHSHTVLEDVQKLTDEEGKINGTYLTSTGTKLNYIGKVSLKGGKVASVESVKTEELTLNPDEEIEKRVKEIRDELFRDYGKVFAKTDVLLQGEKALVRSEPTNLAELINDALMWAVEKNNIDCDISLINGGNIRASIPKGDITKQDINTVLPFNNELCIIKVTGSELLEVMEASTFCTPESIGGYPQVKGMVYTIDTDKKYDAGPNYPDSTYAKPASIQRVSIEEVNGKPFDEKAVYSVVTNDFLASGGDTYYVFKEASSNINLGIPLDEVVMDYIVEELDGVITEEDYGTKDYKKAA